MSVTVAIVVGQFNFFKWYDLFQQLLASKRRIWVHVESYRRWWISFTRHKPSWTVIGVSVAFVINRHYIH